MQLQIFNGNLFVGLLSYEDGFALVKTVSEPLEADPDTWEWEIVTLDGFQDEQIDICGESKATNPYPWSSVVVNDQYYIGTFAGQTRTLTPFWNYWILVLNSGLLPME
jgi:hypothetical protein